jgi:hypothetical protein
MNQILASSGPGNNPAGRESNIVVAWKLAQTEPPPSVVASFPKSVGLRAITSLCWQLHLAAGGGNWYVPCRKGGELLGCSGMAISRFLERLQKLGIITLVKESTAVYSTRFKWNVGELKR